MAFIPQFTHKKDSFAKGTWITRSYPFGMNIAAAALCPDGKVRTVKRIAPTADTYFSIPASVTYKGKTVAGYVTVESIEGFSTPSLGDPAVVKFFPYKYRKNGDLFHDCDRAG